MQNIFKDVGYSVTFSWIQSAVLNHIGYYYSGSTNIMKYNDFPGVMGYYPCGNAHYGLNIQVHNHMRIV